MKYSSDLEKVLDHISFSLEETCLTSNTHHWRVDFQINMKEKNTPLHLEILNYFTVLLKSIKQQIWCDAKVFLTFHGFK